MITHRIKSIKEFDKFYFLNKGVVATANNFDDLFNKNEDFRKLSKFD